VGAVPDRGGRRRVRGVRRLHPGAGEQHPRHHRFFALSDGTATVVDLTAGRGLTCPVKQALCRILAWPDGTLDPTP
jgi:hypothetical protein